MTPARDPSPEASRSALVVAVRRVVGLSAVAGSVEMTGYLDCSSVYPGIMTGNTVQLGLTAATAAWTRLDLIALAVAAFFAGGLIASVVRRHLRRPALELFIMSALLAVASIVRLDPAARVAIELPLLAIAMAMQGETLSRFGGASVQTIVVTNSMLKFTDALAGRYLVRDAQRPGLDEVLLPGLAWLTYSLSAGAGALVTAHFRLPLLIPVLILLAVGADLLRAEKTQEARAAA